MPPLPFSMAYACLTGIEGSTGLKGHQGARQAAVNKYKIEREILKTLGELTSASGDERMDSRTAAAELSPKATAASLCWDRFICQVALSRVWVSKRRTMMRGKGFAGLIALAVIAALTSAAPPKGNAPRSPTVEQTDFTGKVVAVSVKDPIKGAYLEGVQVKRLGGRAFLVGRYAARTQPAPFPEMTYWFPVDEVLVLTVFNNLEDARKAFEAKEQAEKK